MPERVGDCPTAIVPFEPTPAMLLAGCNAAGDVRSVSTVELVRRVWQAMVDA